MNRLTHCLTLTAAAAVASAAQGGVVHYQENFDNPDASSRTFSDYG